MSGWGPLPGMSDDDKAIVSAVACPACGAAVGTRCFFDAFERVGADGVMRELDGIEVHERRRAARNGAKP